MELAPGHSRSASGTRRSERTPPKRRALARRRSSSKIDAAAAEPLRTPFTEEVPGVEAAEDEEEPERLLGTSASEVDGASESDNEDEVGAARTLADAAAVTDE